MRYDEHEKMIEYGEMTAFNFNSKEYKKIKKDFIDCKDATLNLDSFMKNFMNKFVRVEAI